MSANSEIFQFFFLPINSSNIFQKETDRKLKKIWLIDGPHYFCQSTNWLMGFGHLVYMCKLVLSSAEFRARLGISCWFITPQRKRDTRDTISTNTSTSLHRECREVQRGRGQPQSLLECGVLHIQQHRCLSICGLNMALLHGGQYLFSPNHFIPPHVNFLYVLIHASASESAPGHDDYIIISKRSAVIFVLLCLLMYVQPCNSLIYHPQPTHLAVITVQQCT